MHKQVLLGYNQLLVRECFSDLDFLVDGDDSEGGDDVDADGDLTRYIFDIGRYR